MSAAHLLRVVEVQSEMHRSSRARKKALRMKMRQSEVECRRSKESQRQKAKAADRSVRDPLRDEDKAEARDE
jgi:hypothetical protein